MNKVNKHILFVFLVIALLASTSVVFAKELGLLTISGPGIKGEVSLNDHDAMMDIEQSGLFQQTLMLTKPPQNLGEGYNITAHLNLDGDLVPYMQMIYYPTTKGQFAYVRYTARLEGEKLQSIDEWYQLDPVADGALRAAMTASNITVQSALVQAPEKAPEKAPEVIAPVQEQPASAPAAEPVAAPAAAPASPQPYLIPILIVGFLALMGLALVVRRRTVSHTA